MGNKTRLFKNKERKHRSDTGAFLRRLADKISDGRVVLGRGQDQTTLQLSEDLLLEIKAEDKEKAGKGIRHSLEIKFRWFDSQ